MDGSTISGKDLRDAFIQAARRILDEPETSLDLRKVAERVGKSRTAPYLAFGRTEEGGGLVALRLAVAESGFMELLAEIERALTGAPDSEAGLRAAGAVYIAFAQRHPRLFRLMFGPDVARAMASSGGSDTPREVQDVVRSRAELERLMRAAIEGAQREGALSPGNSYPLVMGAWAVFHGAAMLLLDGQLQTAGVATGAEDAADFATSLVLENSTFVVAEAAEALDEAERRKDASHTEPARPVGKISYAAKLERDSDEEWDQRIGELGAAPVERQAPKEEAANEESGRLAETPTIYRALGATTGAVKRFLDPRTVRRIVSRSPALRRARRSLGVLSGSRVLWIDDRPNVNAAERRTLMALGVEVELAIDTVPALELIARRGHGPGGQAFDLIISDIARPDSRTAGIDALPLLRQLAPNTPVIFYVGTSDPNRDPPAGAFGLTTDPSELLHLVIDALERRRG